MLEGRYVGHPGLFGGADEGQHGGGDVSNKTVARVRMRPRPLGGRASCAASAAYRLVVAILAGMNRSMATLPSACPDRSASS